MSNDEYLTGRLESLRQAYEANPDFPDVLAVWEAIHLISLSDPCQFPHWIVKYLFASAEKISRLSLGIRPDDARPLPSGLNREEELSVNEIGELRKVMQTDGPKETKKGRARDKRPDHVASVLGFVRQGKSAFQHHDRVERDAFYLRLYDDSYFEDNRLLQKEHRQVVLNGMMKNENVSKAGAMNRLSRARRCF